MLYFFTWLRLPVVLTGVVRSELRSGMKNNAGGCPWPGCPWPGCPWPGCPWPGYPGFAMAAVPTHGRCVGMAAMANKVLAWCNAKYYINAFLYVTVFGQVTQFANIRPLGMEDLSANSNWLG